MEPAIRYCHACGTAVEPTDKFCPFCGVKLRPPVADRTPSPDYKAYPPFMVGETTETDQDAGFRQISDSPESSGAQQAPFSEANITSRFISPYYAQPMYARAPPSLPPGIWTSYPQRVPEGTWTFFVGGIILLIVALAFASHTANGVLIVVSLAPSAVLLWYYYKKDNRQSEPLSLLSKLFVLGAVAAVPIVVVEFAVMLLFYIFVDLFGLGNNLFTGLLEAIWNAFMVAALIEEGFKFQVVKKFSFNSIAFDERMDAVIYSVSASLGFATLENLLYSAGGLSIAVTRAVTAVPLHTLTAVFMGIYIGRSKFAENLQASKALQRKGLFIAILIHGIYDTGLMSLSAIATYLPEFSWLLSGGPTLVILAFTVAIIVALFIKGNSEIRKLQMEDIGAQIHSEYTTFGRW